MSNFPVFRHRVTGFSTKPRYGNVSIVWICVCNMLHRWLREAHLQMGGWEPWSADTETSMEDGRGWYPTTPSEQWKKGTWVGLGYIGDEILPRYIGIILNHDKNTRWWQLKYFFIFHPYIFGGDVIQFDEYMFQMGLNHQLENDLQRIRRWYGDDEFAVRWFDR